MKDEKKEFFVEFLEIMAVFSLGQFQLERVRKVRKYSENTLSSV